MLPEDIREAAGKFFNKEITSITRLGGGKNSRVYKVETAIQTIVLKHYFRSESDPRDRQGTELDALQLMISFGDQNVPIVRSIDRELGYTLLSFMDGEIITEAEMTEADEQAFVDFVAALIEASDSDGAAKIAPASEAFFTLDEVVGNIEARLSRLEGCPASAPMAGELNEFLVDRFRPALAKLSGQAVSYYEECGLTGDSVLAAGHRVLSPSDFGLHNCLKTEDGLVFLDFEYFGWDDPVKMVSDYVLHPAQGQAGPKRLAVAKRMLSLFADQPCIHTRFKALFPLFGLKWCMIMLNEFLVEENARREFAGADTDHETILKHQLDKADSMLERALSGNEPAELAS